MQDHEVILKMIEEVSPDDTAKLDEIDARVFAIDLQHEFIKYDAEQFIMWTKAPSGLQMLWDKGIPEYTRSRDALKAIRPEGYLSWAFLGGSKWNDEIYGRCALPGRKHHEGFGTEEPLPTEELAELHAIIQAIAYERSHA